MIEQDSMTIHDDRAVAVIRVSNPPVNVFNRGLRAQVLAGVEAAMADPAVKVIVLVGDGAHFVTGADIEEFKTEIAAPDFRCVLGAIESGAKPVVAVLHGSTLGAGVELAMACHYRVAMKGVRIGFPEIGLGLIPGAGATQRLPRLVGMETALELLLSASQLGAEEALASGLVDRIAEGSPAEAGMAAARDILAGSAETRRTCALAAGALSPEAEAAIMARHARSLRGRTTQIALPRAIRAAGGADFEAGLDTEAALCKASLASRESEALRHMFFAERRSAVLPGIGKDLSPGNIARVAVIGAGTMGSGIAMSFANAGFAVTLVDTKEAGLDRGRAIITGVYKGDARKGRITEEQASAKVAAITFSLSLADIADVDLVVEAVFEDMALKQSVLAEVDRIVRPGAIIASNTSSLSVTQLGRATGRPGQVVGLHFFSPAHVMKLLEIVRGDDTTPETLATALAVGARIRKIPVVAGDGFGFIGNRMMLDGAFREAEHMLLEGAGVSEVDDAIEAFGFAMGPSRVNDMAGVDIGTLVRQQLALREVRADPYCVVSDALTPLGRTGQKAGLGFYRYEPGQRQGQEDPEVSAIIARLAADRNIVRRSFETAEIQERFVLQLINVGADILAEGLAWRASDIDVVWVHGYGFPRHLGGPMFHADTLGLPHVLERIRHYHAVHGDYWKPSALLEELVQAGQSFADYDARPLAG